MANDPRHACRATSRRSRQAGGASVALRFGRLAAMGAIAVLILIAGVWASWGTRAARDAEPRGGSSGTMTVTRCARRTSARGRTRRRRRGRGPGRGSTSSRSVAVQKGRTYTVVVKPGSGDVVRTGPPGLLHAWVPLGGALLLASVVVRAGCGWRGRRGCWRAGRRAARRRPAWRSAVAARCDVRACARPWSARTAAVTDGRRSSATRVSRCCAGPRRRR